MEEAEQASVVRMRGVGKTYRGNAVEVAALRDISVSIAAGRFSMIVGPSGSGKTTLLHLVGCIDAPTEGEMEVVGQDTGKLGDDALSDFRARTIGFIFQNFSLMPVLSAYENIEYPLILRGVPAAERRRAVEEMLEAVGLADQSRQRPHQLSGGQKQRVAIARALVKRPQLVLADEPTANLDSETGAQIIALMRGMQREQRVSFIFSTHDPQLISHADETFTLRDGRLQDRGEGGAGR